MAYREVYYVDYAGDFGLSGLAGTVCRRTGLRVDGPTVAALAARAVLDDEDERLGEDARLLLESPVPDGALNAVWLAATRRAFDPAEDGTDTRAWLRRLRGIRPPRPSAARSGDGPTVTEEELREAVSAELRLLAPALTTAVAVPDLVPALDRVVREADADLGLRLLLRALKAYAVPVPHDQYQRFLGLGERLDYPLTAVFEDLSVRWPPLGTGRRDFVFGFGLPRLSRLFDGEWDAWRYEGSGTPREHVVRLAHADSGLVPGSQAAVLLEDVTCLLDSPIPDERITALWRGAARREHAREDFDADGRTWLRLVAEVCRERLADVDPVYTPVPRPPRTDLTAAVLTEIAGVAEVAGDADAAVDAVEIAEAEARVTVPLLDAAGAGLVRAVVAEADPDLGFRLLLRLLDARAAAVTEARYARFERLADRLGCDAGYARREIERRVTR